MAAAFQEKLAVNDGQVISPQPLKGSSTSPSPSIGQLIFAIDNDKDFDDYVLKHASKVPTTHSDVKYEKHPVRSSAYTHLAFPKLTA